MVSRLKWLRPAPRRRYFGSVKARLLPALILIAFLPIMADAAPLPVVMRDGEEHVTAAALEREAGIVTKRLPGRGEYVVCAKEICAPLKGVAADGETLFVPVAALSEALSLAANFDDTRGHVALVAQPRDAAAPAGPARVGAIAPNLRLTRLDGTTVTLDELRGQRVLINSWASW